MNKTIHRNQHKMSAKITDTSKGVQTCRNDACAQSINFLSLIFN